MSQIENLRWWPEDWTQTWNLLVWLLGFNLVVCLLSLVSAYASGRARALLKEPDGRLPLFSWIMFWPYYLHNHLVFAAWRFLTREPPFAEVAPGVYLGRRLRESEAGLVAHLEPLAVLDLTAEFGEAPFLRERPEYLCLPVLDMTAPRPKTLERALQFIAAHAGPRTVYVHCALGHGRSAAVVLAWLLRTKQAASFEAGYAALRAQRAGVRLNRAQQQAVRRCAALTPA
jgi:hypothetical protein